MNQSSQMFIATVLQALDRWQSPKKSLQAKTESSKKIFRDIMQSVDSDHLRGSCSQDQKKYYLMHAAAMTDNPNFPQPDVNDKSYTDSNVNDDAKNNDNTSSTIDDCVKRVQEFD